MQVPRIGIALIALIAMAACVPAGGFRAGDGPYAPGLAPDAARNSVDGLIVGHRLMEAGEYELALKAYYRAATVVGINADVLSAVGSANLKLGRLGQAEDNLRKAIELEDEFVPAWNNLGVVLMEQRNYAEAALVFQRAFALDSGETAEIRDNLALALAKRQNPAYFEAEEGSGPSLVRRGTGDFLLQTVPDEEEKQEAGAEQ